MPEIHTILDQIDSGAMALPMFQRGYVWNRDQVRALFTSLYRGYLIGSLLMNWDANQINVGAILIGGKDASEKAVGCLSGFGCTVSAYWDRVVRLSSIK